MDVNKRKKWKYFIAGLCLFVVFLLLGTCTEGVLSPVPFLYLGSFQGTVVDAETQEPISGAAVLAVYYKSGPSPAGSISVAVDAQEALTDDKGDFRIPSAMRWFSLKRGFTEDRIILFKPGYGAFPRHGRSQADGERKSNDNNSAGVIYEIPKLRTQEERAKNALDVAIRYDVEFNKQKTLINALNTEFTDLGMLDRYVEKNRKPFLEVRRQVR